MNINAETPIGDIVRSNYRTSELFENLPIDFCCGGEKSLAMACAELDISVSDLITEVESILKVGDWDASYLDSLSPSELCDYIVKRHHGYVNENLPLISQRLKKLADVHGREHPGLTEVESLFRVTGQYRVPPGGCNTFKVTYHSLKEFEKDLHRRVHLENNLLFPKFLKIAEEMDRQ